MMVRTGDGMEPLGVGAEAAVQSSSFTGSVLPLAPAVCDGCRFPLPCREDSFQRTGITPVKPSWRGNGH